MNKPDHGLVLSDADGCFFLALARGETAVRLAGEDHYGTGDACLAAARVKQLSQAGLVAVCTIASGGFREVEATPGGVAIGNLYGACRRQLRQLSARTGVDFLFSHMKSAGEIGREAQIGWEEAKAEARP